jgi:D-alanyl-lipoteichoic acid acyltransferase DltB (MBOAT superfamily)
MSTTQLFAELLVSGTGVVIWLAFLLAWAFRISFQDLTSDANIFTLAPIVAIAYVLGIVMDRLGYSIFRGSEHRLRNRIVDSKESPPIRDQEMYVVTNSNELGLQINYNRSRLRICRSWIINFILIAISSALWGYSFDPGTALYLPIASLLLSLATLFIWSRLVIDHYRNIQTSYNYLKTHRPPKHQKS